MNTMQGLKFLFDQSRNTASQRVSGSSLQYHLLINVLIFKSINIAWTFGCYGFCDHCLARTPSGPDNIAPVGGRSNSPALKPPSDRNGAHNGVKDNLLLPCEATDIFKLCDEMFRVYDIAQHMKFVLVQCLQNLSIATLLF